MALIEFSKEEKEILVERIKVYFDENLNQELGQFEAEFLLNFFVDEIGPYFYNSGVNDARAQVHKQLDNIDEFLDSLEKPTEFIK